MGDVTFSSDINYPIYDAKSYIEKSKDFFTYYDDVAFKSYNLDAFERRLGELRAAHADSNNNKYQILAAELVIGYNVLHTYETKDKVPIFTNVYTPTFYTYETRDSKSTLEGIGNALKDLVGTPSKKKLTTHTTDLTYLTYLKSYVVDSNVALTEKEYLYKFSIPKPVGHSIVELSMRAAFNAAPYFYNDFKNFLTHHQKQTLIGSSEISRDTLSTNIEIEELKNTIMTSNKTVIYLLLAAGAVAVALKVYKP